MTHICPTCKWHGDCDDESRYINIENCGDYKEVRKHKNVRIAVTIQEPYIVDIQSAENRQKVEIPDGCDAHLTCKDCSFDCSEQIATAQLIGKFRNHLNKKNEL